ncbi:MAG: class I SAM-dependent methyltransferase [Candidatus Omnitrophica bacterium]|nr:class I SAM-dependent methyltransferase [Candidatus Omnitrophota bacterium]
MASTESVLIGDRWDVMKPLLAGKSVLDLGCVDHQAKQESGEEWLHKKIQSVARDLLGVDYKIEEVEALRAKGYKVEAGNVEALELGRTFDVITAGNIIEHVSNPGNFLESVKRHMQADSLFLLTTDNCYGLRSLKGIFLNDSIIPNQEHVATYEEKVLRQLFARHGLEITGFYFYNGPYANPWKEKLIYFLSRIRKNFAWQMLVVARKGG